MKKLKWLLPLIVIFGFGYFLISVPTMLSSILGSVGGYQASQNDSEGGGDVDLNGLDGNVYSPELIRAAAKAMQAEVDDNYIKLVEATIQSESGGQNIIQTIHDRNSGGNEARGILQYVPSTFMTYALKGHTNVMSPIDQLLAFFNNSDYKNAIGHTVIWGVPKIDWLHAGPQGRPRFKEIPGTLDLKGINTNPTSSDGKGNQTSIGKITWTNSDNTYPVGQCTWWAKARAPWSGNWWGNGCQWADSGRRNGFKVDNQPAKGAIVSFAPGVVLGNWTTAAVYGHVAVVEAYNKANGTITISQGGTGFSQQPGPNLQTIGNVHAYQYVHPK